MDSLVSGLLALVTTPSSLVIFLAAMVGGLVFGAVPGVNILTLAAVILPFTVHMSVENAIMFFGVVYVTGVYGGAITAILFNIPGSPENAPTAFDGYPMTKRGEASKAIGAAMTASALGGLVSCVVMMLSIEAIAFWAVRSFGPVEIFFLVIFALCSCASLGAQTYWKGWISVIIGMMLATIGTEPTSGLPRYVFGTAYLSAGINFVALIIGLFAVAEILTQTSERGPRNVEHKRVSATLPKLSEFWRMRYLIGRSSGVGFFSGLLPGIGATLAAFLSYAAAAYYQKTDPPLGKGNVDGVVASEAANNSATASALIPLLALGLPGGALTAIMLGAFQMHGIEPGPMVFVHSERLVWMLFGAMLVANACILLLGYVEARCIVHLLRVPFGILGPVILVFSIVGAYALRNLTVDVWVALIAGVAGYLLRRTGYSVAGVILGVILGGIAEGNFVKTIQILERTPYHLFGRPVALVLLLASVTVLIASLGRRYKVPRRVDAGRNQNKQ